MDFPNFCGISKSRSNAMLILRIFMLTPKFNVSMTSHDSNAKGIEIHLYFVSLGEFPEFPEILILSLMEFPYFLFQNFQILLKL